MTKLTGVALMLALGASLPVLTAQAPAPTDTTTQPDPQHVESVQNQAAHDSNPRPPSKPKTPTPAPAETQKPNPDPKTQNVSEATALELKHFLDLRKQLTEQRGLLEQLKNLPPPKPPSTPKWLLPLILVAATASVTSVALLAFALWRFRRRTASQKDDESAAIRELGSMLKGLEGAQRMLDDRLQQTAASLSDRLSVRNLLTIDDFRPITTDLSRLETTIAQLGRLVEEAANTETSPSADPVVLEHQVLAEHWKQFRDRKDLGGAPETQPWDPILSDFGSHVPDELRPTFDSVMVPYREYRTLAQKVTIIPRVVTGEIRLPSDAAEVMRTRELTSLLATIQSSDGADRLQFRFKSWITDTFLPFADLYLQKYQQATLDKRGAEMQVGVKLMRQLLRIAAVEPIDVTPGETPFDSTRHIGRSTTSDPRFSDGVITGVVRNGFIEGGQQVIRQPEVIVNRMR